jgi:hypothetical protein
MSYDERGAELPLSLTISLGRRKQSGRDHSTSENRLYALIQMPLVSCCDACRGFPIFAFVCDDAPESPRKNVGGLRRHYVSDLRFIFH